MEIMNNTSVLLGVLMVVAFVVNIIVQLTKGIVPIPTKLWVIIVSAVVTMASVFIGASFDYLRIDAATILLSLIGSFVVAYVAMYGFDTLKELWTRFKGGGNINEDN